MATQTKLLIGLSLITLIVVFALLSRRVYSNMQMSCTRDYAIDIEQIRREEYAKAAAIFRELIPTASPSATLTPTMRVVYPIATPTTVQ